MKKTSPDQKSTVPSVEAKTDLTPPKSKAGLGMTQGPELDIHAPIARKALGQQALAKATLKRLGQSDIKR